MMHFNVKKVLPLLAAGMLAPVMAQDLNPEKNGGWQPAKTGKNGEFSIVKGDRMVLSAAIFEVDPKATYELSGKFRSDGSDPKNKLLFFGAEAYTPGYQIITSPQVNAFPGTETELAKDVKKTDTVLYVKDASAWNVKTSAGVVAFNAQDNYADLPNPRCTSNIAKIEKNGDVWQITLKGGAYHAFPAGTRVRQHAHGMGRTFFVAFYKPVKSEQWTEIKGKISGIAPFGAARNQWWKGTASARICISGTPGVMFKDIVLKKVGGEVKIIPAATVKKK